MWIIVGRRGGKDSVARDLQDCFRPGERPLCMALACDRDQAKIVLAYTRAYFRNIPPLQAMVTRLTIYRNHRYRAEHHQDKNVLRIRLRPRSKVAMIGEAIGFLLRNRPAS
jgi:hypothetical protein